MVNKRLPAGIALRGAVPVPPNAQARYDATERTYDYFFHARPDAFLNRSSALLDLTDFDPARVAALLPVLLDHREYRAFCKAPDRHNTTLVTFAGATLWRGPTGNRYRLRFSANRFLRGMIRLLVHHLVAVGTGRLSPEAFARALASGERTAVFRLAPPQGLYLTGVRYPYLDRPPELPPAGQIAWTSV